MHYNVKQKYFLSFKQNFMIALEFRFVKKLKMAEELIFQMVKQC